MPNQYEIPSFGAKNDTLLGWMLEAKAEGELEYASYKRAVWYSADLTQPGQLDLRLEITPPGDSVNDEFDLGFEVLDPGNRVIMRSDNQEGDDTGDLNKTKSLKDLEPGKYLIHLYLQHRLDSADYVLRASFKPIAERRITVTVSRPGLNVRSRESYRSSDRLRPR